jgi:hypothetical protein
MLCPYVAMAIIWIRVDLRNGLANQYRHAASARAMVKPAAPATGARRPFVQYTGWRGTGSY